MVRGILLAFVVILSSCNFDQQPEGATGEPVSMSMPRQDSVVADGILVADTIVAAENADEYVDSFLIKMDSLMAAKIKLPPIYRYEIISGNAASVDKFSALAKSSGGKIKILVNSGLVAKEVVHMINTISRPESDLLLLIDKTGSMGNDIEGIKQSLGQIIDTIKKYKNTRLAVAFYGDKNADGMAWFEFKNFETNYEAARIYINTVQVKGGGDWPESVYDAVIKCMDGDFWKSSKKRNIILVGDAPPLEKPLSDYSLSDITSRARSGGIIMNFYPIIITPTAEAAKVEKTVLDTYRPEKLSSSIYPNPCKGVINVAFEECSNYYLEIYDAAGREIVSEQTYGVHWTKDLSDAPDGMYILRIIDKSHKFELFKFILRH